MRATPFFISGYFLAPILSILFICGSASTVAQVYKYEDEQGNVVYSDTPPLDDQGMAPADLPDIIVQPSVEVPENMSRPDDADASAISVSIITPANEATIHNGEAAVGVSASASRPLNNNESAFLIVNGAEHSSSSSLTWSLTELERGEMQLAVQIRDSNDDVLASSEAIVVFVQRANVRPIAAPRSN